MDGTSSDTPDFILPSLQEKAKPTGETAGPDFVLPSQRNAPPGLTTDISRGAVSGAERGVIQAPGIVESLLNLPETLVGGATLGGMYAGEKMGILPEGTYEKGKQAVSEMQQLAPTEAERKGYVSKVAGLPLPTSAGMMELAKQSGVPMAPRPQTVPGKIVEAGTEALPMAAVGPGGAAERALTQFVSGAGNEAAGLATEGSQYEPFARIVGGIGGGAAVAGPAAMISARSPQNIEEVGSQLAGKVARESFVQPDVAQKALAVPPPAFVPEVQPTTAQELQVKGASDAAKQAQALAQKVTGIKEFENTPEAQALRNQMEVSDQNLAAQAERTAQQASSAVGKPIDVSTSFGLSGLNPQGEASINVRNMITALDQKLDDQAKAAWKDPQLQSAGVYKNKSVAELKDYLDNLSQAKQSAFPAEITKILDNISNMEGSQVPFSEFQDLRSLALAQARKAYTSPNVVDAPALYGFANKVGDILSNPNNIRFGNTYGEIEAWNKARAATKQYYDTFGDGFLSNMVDNEKISPEVTLDKLYSGAAGPNNLRELRNVFGDQADKNVSDWMVGKLTKNGEKIDITPDNVNSFMSDPKNAAMINEVTGLSDRLAAIAQRAGESDEQSQIRQFADSFAKINEKNNPKMLANFLDAHPDMIGKVFPDPNQQDYVNALHNSAKALSKIGNAKLVPSETLNNLIDNNMFTLLYGRATGAISDSVIGALAGHALESATHIAGASPVGGALSFLGAGKRIVPAVFNKANDWVFGGTREEAIRKLQEAAGNPVLMQALLNNPDPNGWSRLGNALANVAGRIALPVAEQQIREGRKSGGRVNHIDQKVNKLIRESARIKNLLADETERMLSLPDDTIAHALSLAKKVI
jgi:hypothetical protein